MKSSVWEPTEPHRGVTFPFSQSEFLSIGIGTECVIGGVGGGGWDGGDCCGVRGVNRLLKGISRGSGSVHLGFWLSANAPIFTVSFNELLKS